jgi:S-adenosylmethionine decarboxylase
VSQTLGHHILLELSGVTRSLLDDAKGLEAELVRAAERGGAHVVESRFCHFQPQGVSGVVILAESHVTVHTWPEFGFAAVDVFTCGEATIARRVSEEVVAALRPREHQTRTLQRGPLRELRAS